MTNCSFEKSFVGTELKRIGDNWKPKPEHEILIIQEAQALLDYLILYNDFIIIVIIFSESLNSFFDNSF